MKQKSNIRHFLAQDLNRIILKSMSSTCLDVLGAWQIQKTLNDHLDDQNTKYQNQKLKI